MATSEDPAPVSKPFQYGGSFLRSAVQAVQQQDGAIEGPREELQLYLKSGAESTTDVIGWWGVSPCIFECACMTNRAPRITPDTLPCAGLPGIILPFRGQPLHLSEPSVVEALLAVHEGTGCNQQFLKLFSSLKALIETDISQQARRQRSTQRMHSRGS